MLTTQMQPTPTFEHDVYLNMSLPQEHDSLHVAHLAAKALERLTHCDCVGDGSWHQVLGRIDGRV